MMRGGVLRRNWVPPYLDPGSAVGQWPGSPLIILSAKGIINNGSLRRPVGLNEKDQE